jgi:hypothetical protein
MSPLSSLLPPCRLWTVGALAAFAVATTGLLNGAQLVQAAGPVSCHGRLYAHAHGGPAYRVTDLTVRHTTCAVGRRLSSRIPAYRVPRPLRVAGFRCRATTHYANPQLPAAGGYQQLACRRRREAVRWHLEVPSEI